MARAKKPRERRRVGDGSITEIVKGEHYLQRWFETDPVTGKKRQRSHHFYGTERQANDELKRILVAVADGKKQPGSNRMTLAELAEEYLAYVEKANKKRTYYSYSDTLRKHVLPTMGQIPVNRITPKQVRDLLAVKEQEPQPSKKKNPVKSDPVKFYSGRTIEYIQVVLHAMFEYAIDLKYVAENPADLKKSFAVNLVDPDDPDELDGDDDEDDVPIWTREQFLSFHEYARDDYFYPAYCIAATQGKRRGEVLGIKWPRVDLDTGKIFIKMAVQRFPHEGIQPCSLKDRRKKKGKNVDARQSSSCWARKCWPCCGGTGKSSNRSERPWVISTGTRAGCSAGKMAGRMILRPAPHILKRYVRKRGCRPLPRCITCGTTSPRTCKTFICRSGRCKNSMVTPMFRQQEATTMTPSRGRKMRHSPWKELSSRGVRIHRTNLNPGTIRSD